MSFEEFYGFFRSFFGGPESNGDQKEKNPFNEIQILSEHTDIIRVFLLIDETRFVSSSDDGVIVVWDVCQAAPVWVFHGHHGPVTSFLLLENGLLVSGSVDRDLRLWNLTTGKCVKTITNCHEGGIKCLTSIGNDRFCSGANDKFLHIWNGSGDMVGFIERKENEEENILCMLAISNERVIIGSSSALLFAYRTDTMQYSVKFTCHRESVRCLTNIDEHTFVSGSLDGVIIVWQTESLSPLKKLNYPDQYFSASLDRKHYTESINHLLVIGKKYLAACINNGFKIFDLSTGDSVMDCPRAHESSVNSIISVYGGTRFVTASADAQIKLWGTSKDFNFVLDEDIPDSTKLRQKKNLNFPPVCLGDMWGHTDQVKLLLKISETCFASGSHDNLIILWKDGELESELRNSDAILSFYKMNSNFTGSDREDLELVDEEESVEESSDPCSQMLSGSPKKTNGWNILDHIGLSFKKTESPERSPNTIKTNTTQDSQITTPKQTSQIYGEHDQQCDITCVSPLFGK